MLIFHMKFQDLYPHAMEFEPEYWGVKLDDGEVSYGYINEFDFLV